MQIVIDIDEEIFNKLPEAELGSNVIEDVLEAVENGTILSKEHGRIADMDEAIKCIKDVEGDDAIWAISLIEWACAKRTIIEADKR